MSQEQTKQAVREQLRKLQKRMGYLSQQQIWHGLNAEETKEFNKNRREQKALFAKLKA